jgi:NLR family CARD domain-containing protein 3
MSTLTHKKKENQKQTETEDPYPTFVQLRTLDEIVKALNRPYGKPKVQILDVSGMSLGDDLAGRVATGMQKNPRGIEELTLVENLLGPRSGERLASGLVQSRSLTKLNLSKNSLGDRGLAALCTALLTNVTLTSLNVASNSIGSTNCGPWLEKMCEVLSKKKLKELDVSDNLCAYPDLMRIVESFHSPSCNLIMFNISMNPVSDLGIESLGLALEKGAMNTLKSLKLTCVGMGPVGSEALGRALRSEHCQVEVLWIDNNPDVGKKGMSTFLKSTFHANKCCKLIEFKMGGTMSRYDPTAAMPNPRIRPFVNTYAVDTPLVTTATVGDGSKIEKENEQKEQKEQKKEQKESAMLLTASDVTVSVWTVLSQALSLNKTLITLDISEELSMDDDACSDLVPGLMQNISITNVVLEGNNIGDEGAALLSDVFHEQRTLLHVSLRRNNIGDEGGMALSESLIENNALLTLDVAHNSMDTEGEIFIL